MLYPKTLSEHNFRKLISKSESTRKTVKNKFRMHKSTKSQNVNTLVRASEADSLT
jgi:hypothetical protein